MYIKQKGINTKISKKTNKQQQQQQEECKVN